MFVVLIKSVPNNNVLKTYFVCMVTMITFLFKTFVFLSFLGSQVVTRSHVMTLMVSNTVLLG